jgi:WD40 repeat protein
MKRHALILIVLTLAPTLYGDDKVPALKKLAEAEVKQARSLAVSRKSGEVVVCSDLDVQVRDAKTLKLTKTYRGAGSRAAFVLDDKALIVSGALRTGIELLDRKSGESTILNYGEPDCQTHVALNLLAYRAEGKNGATIVVYDLAKKKILKKWEPGAWVGSPGLRGFSSKGVLIGDCIKTTKRDNKTALVDCLLLWAPPFDRDPKLIECDAEPHCATLAPDGKTALLGNERKVDVWDLEKGKKTKSFSLPLPGGRVSVLAFSPDGKRLAALVSRNANRKRGLDDVGESELVVYDAETFKAVAAGEVHRSPSRLLAWLSEGKRLATAGRFDNRLRLWGVP